jgi:3-mercaptopyruvate sulfurtransferase SseA
MGNEQSCINKVNFEDIKKVSKNDYILINTLNSTNQQCLIVNTIPIDKEVHIVEKAIKEKKIIIIYGKNTNDYTIYKKYNQLVSMGHKNTYLYCGGLFEWLTLQDIYGNEQFKTTSSELDILKYKSDSDLNKLLIKN